MEQEKNIVLCTLKRISFNEDGSQRLDLILGNFHNAVQINLTDKDTQLHYDFQDPLEYKVLNFDNGIVIDQGKINILDRFLNFNPEQIENQKKALVNIRIKGKKVEFIIQFSFEFNSYSKQCLWKKITKNHFCNNEIDLKNNVPNKAIFNKNANSKEKNFSLRKLFFCCCRRKKLN